MSSFSVSRSVLIDARPARVHDLIEDLHEWERWSPWQDADPMMEQTYSRRTAGVGASMEWSGNRRAGAGRMEIRRSEPTLVEVLVSFTKPFAAENLSRFELVETPRGTEVTWTMTGEQSPVARLAFTLMRMEKAIGKDFERGLARLKTEAERRRQGA